MRIFISTEFLTLLTNFCLILKIYLKNILVKLVQSVFWHVLFPFIITKLLTVLAPFT